VLALLLLLAAVFAVLLTAAERFFCPALEIISEALRLPPAVAGATLLSFGNGATDLFTQFAAISGVRWRVRVCVSCVCVCVCVCVCAGVCQRVRCAACMPSLLAHTR
jgi:Ca2+/Na+ antiporter